LARNNLLSERRKRKKKNLSRGGFFKPNEERKLHGRTSGEKRPGGRENRLSHSLERGNERGGGSRMRCKIPPNVNFTQKGNSGRNFPTVPVRRKRKEGEKRESKINKVPVDRFGSGRRLPEKGDGSKSGGKDAPQR